MKKKIFSKKLEKNRTNHTSISNVEFKLETIKSRPRIFLLKLSVLNSFIYVKGTITTIASLKTRSFYIYERK